VSKPTLARFFSLHYLMPFIVLVLVFIHLFYLHNTGSSNPSFLTSIINRAYVNFYPYIILKDINTLLIVLFLYIYIVFFLPDVLGHSDNYIEANSLVTPTHIVPE
jgi:ubiquinol-cytochrome c reductase cytochrome b subunit